jgi:hypothetical protein
MHRDAVAAVRSEGDADQSAGTVLCAIARSSLRPEVERANMELVTVRAPIGVASGG